MGGKQKKRWLIMYLEMAVFSLIIGFLISSYLLGSCHKNVFNGSVITLRNIAQEKPPVSLLKSVLKYYKNNHYKFIIVNGFSEGPIESFENLEESYKKAIRFFKCSDGRFVEKVFGVRSRICACESDKQQFELDKKKLNIKKLELETGKQIMKLDEKKTRLVNNTKKMLLYLYKKKEQWKTNEKGQPFKPPKDKIKLKYKIRNKELEFKKEMRLLEFANKKKLFEFGIKKAKIENDNEKLFEINKKKISLDLDEKKVLVDFKKEIELLKLEKKSEEKFFGKNLSLKEDEKDLSSLEKLNKYIINNFSKFYKSKQLELTEQQTRINNAVKLEKKNRLFTLKDETWRKLKKENLFRLKEKPFKDTYINAGCMFGHLRFMEFYKKEKPKFLRRPKSWLIQVVANAPSIADNWTAFYEKRLSDDFKPLITFLKNKKLLNKLVPIKTFEKLLILCEYLGVGGAQKVHSGNLFVNPEEKDEKKRYIVLISVGQPYKTRPEQFFNADWNAKDPKKSFYLKMVIRGICNLYKDFEGEIYRKKIEEFVKTRKRLQGASNFKNLKDLFSKTK